jgi:D-cysteine desulfhydrase family pyridoxal phosphate-dependent enzyme
MAGRVRLAILPTPIHPLPRFSRAVGREVWIKRDDLTGLATGGNKVRKVELLAAAARRAGADVLVSVGAPQSNHARTVAAAASVLGMHCHLVVSGVRPERPTGNLALDQLLGATLHFVESKDWGVLDKATQTVAGELKKRGLRPYLIPVGGSVPLGALAFTAAYFELRAQLAAAGLRPSAIVHASSSGGTQAGLELGRMLVGDSTPILGVDVAKITNPLSGTVARFVREAAELLEVEVGEPSPTVIDGYIGCGYAIPSPESTKALRLLAVTEGIIADPVYTAKALHALCAEDLGGPVIFWHTGGVPAVFSDEVGIGSWRSGWSA